MVNGWCNGMTMFVSFDICLSHSLTSGKWKTNVMGYDISIQGESGDRLYIPIILNA